MEEQERHELYKKVFDTKEGEKVILDLCDITGITKFKSARTFESLLLEKGAQRVVHSIMKTLGKDPRKILNRMMENNDETQKNHILNYE